MRITAAMPPLAFTPHILWHRQLIDDGVTFGRMPFRITNHLDFRPLFRVFDTDEAPNQP
jgi:hypothetical protein